jgi:putative tryptophan/tyrosine transport system substrate-binding protein
MRSEFNRREAITLLGVAAVGPRVAHAQQPTRVIGFLSSRSPGESAHIVAAFRQGLKEAGYVEGQNIKIEYRWAEGRYDQLPALATDLVSQKVAVIATTGGQASALAAKAATSTIPVVFTTGEDPVKLGIVASLNRPGGNLTGVNVLLSEMESKRLGLLHEVIQPPLIGVLLNPKYPGSDIQLNDVQGAARTLGQQIHVLNASSEDEIRAAFTTFAQMHVGALSVGADPFFAGRHKLLASLAAQYAIPAIYELREYAVGGGLMSYGTSLPDALRLVGVYVGRILKGEKAGDLPVQQPTKFDFVMNLKTAKTLGLAFPPGLLAIATEVIE